MAKVGPGPTLDLLTQYADAVVGVKPDRMIIRYVAAALGIAERALAPKKAAALVRGGRPREGMGRFTLDHTIWRYQSDRPHTSRRTAAADPSRACCLVFKG